MFLIHALISVCTIHDEYKANPPKRAIKYFYGALGQREK